MSRSVTSTGAEPPRSAPPESPALWRRLGALLRDQWIVASLLALAWCGDSVLLLSAQHSKQMIPGIAVMVVLAVFGRRHPVRCGLAMAAVLCANTVLAVQTDAYLHSGGLWKILPTENVVGLLLVCYLFQRVPLRKAIPVTAVLVVACVGAAIVRVGVTGQISAGYLAWTMGFGFLQLLLAVGTGLYLSWQRRTRDDARTTRFRSLVGAQWPVMAALSVLLFLDFLNMTQADGSVVAGVAALVCGAVMSVLAVAGPTRPFEAAVLGALALALTAAAMWLIEAEAERTLIGSVPIAATGAGMLLLAYVARYVEPGRAVSAGAALVGSGLFALFGVPVDSGGGSGRFDDTESIFFGGLLMVISVGTGMYFRARDRERANSVRNAVADAQNSERMALARELHDVVAHHVTGIVVQAQAAQMVAAKNPAAATDALANIADSGTEALTAMRRLVASMRGAEPAGASEATEQATTDFEADLEALVATARRVPEGSGDAVLPTVNLRVDLGRTIPPEVARSALRVVQESLTNSEKHALDVSYIEIDVRADLENLHARVADNGTGIRRQPVGGSGGYGLVGMRERIELLGGRFWAGPGEHVGWRVEAMLPLAERNGEVGQR